MITNDRYLSLCAQNSTAAPAEFKSSLALRFRSLASRLIVRRRLHERASNVTAFGVADAPWVEFLQEPLIPINPPKNTCFELELLRPCSKKEDPATIRQKRLETIEILSQDNFAIAYTDGSSDRSLSNGGAGILLLLPDGNNYKHKINTGIIASNFPSEIMAIREALILYQQDPHVIDYTEGLVIFSDSKSAIEAIRNGETNISCDIVTLL
ncbi:ribonuclease H [Trichonephila clavipes]|nr:ribonuclease H [Trichonephila clavipes]